MFLLTDTFTVSKAILKTPITILFVIINLVYLSKFPCSPDH